MADLRCAGSGHPESFDDRTQACVFGFTRGFVDNTVLRYNRAFPITTEPP